MLGKKHKNHDFESIKNIYEQHVELIKSQTHQLQAKIKYLTQLMMQVDEQIETVNTNKEIR